MKKQRNKQIKKILIVEDEKPLLKALSNQFKKEGYKVLLASNGEEGLGLAKEEKPDIILLDIIMPVMDGMTMLRELRVSKFGKNLPVVFLTNLSDSDKMKEAEEKGVYDFLIKTNWKIKDVVRVVKEKIN